MSNSDFLGQRWQVIIFHWQAPCCDPDCNCKEPRSSSPLVTSFVPTIWLAATLAFRSYLSAVASFLFRSLLLLLFQLFHFVGHEILLLRFSCTPLVTSSLGSNSSVSFVAILISFQVFHSLRSLVLSFQVFRFAC